VRPDRATSDPVYELALRWLSQRDRTASQLQDRLERAGFARPDITRAIERLRELGYLDDRRFAAARARSLLESGRLGPMGIEARLAAAGIARPEARAVVRELMEGQDESTWARTLVMRRGQGALPSTPREQARERRFLLGRGFSAGAVEKVLGPEPLEDA
jgi:regulatory protein